MRQSLVFALGSCSRYLLSGIQKTFCSIRDEAEEFRNHQFFWCYISKYSAFPDRYRRVPLRVTSIGKGYCSNCTGSYCRVSSFMPVRPLVYITSEKSRIVSQSIVFRFYCLPLFSKKRNMGAEQNVLDYTIYIMSKPCWSDFHVTYKSKSFSLRFVECVYRIAWV